MDKEKGLVKFNFKVLPDGSLDKNKVIVPLVKGNHRKFAT